MDKIRKLELIQRSLALRHKLKVHEAMPQPATHEDIAVMLSAKWEYEDELRAIEEILAESRAKNVAVKREKFMVSESEGAEAAAAAAELSSKTAKAKRPVQAAKTR